jgi:hypothetical protein
MAQTLRDAFTAKGVSLTHSESLGFHDWNELAARIASERKPPDAEPPRLPSIKPARQKIAVDAGRLDGYVGFYQHTDSFVMTETRDGNQLFIYTGQSRLQSILRAILSFSSESSMQRSVSSQTRISDIASKWPRHADETH